MMFLKKVDMKRFKGLRKPLHNQYSRGLSQYPQDLAAAYIMITSHHLAATATPTRKETMGISVLQTSTHQSDTEQVKRAPQTKNHQNDTVQGQRERQDQRAPIVRTDGKLHQGLRCYACNG